jgi:DNA-binding transcriptional regulator YiaG
MVGKLIEIQRGNRPNSAQLKPFSSKKQGNFRQTTLPGIDRTIEHLLVSRHKQAELKQKDVAIRTGITRQWIGRWERGRAFPTSAQWGVLRAVLKLPATLQVP